MLRGDNSARYGWLIGGGLTSLSAAVFMIRDGKMDGKNIHIFEEVNRSSWKHRIYPDTEPIFGKQQIELDSYTTFLDLLSEIPSAANPTISAKEELINFNRESGNIPNQYHTILLSIRQWLKNQGCIFYIDSSVQKLELKRYADTDEQVVSEIVYREGIHKETKEIGFEDIVIIGNEYMAGPVPQNCHNLKYLGYLTDNPENRYYSMEEKVNNSKEVVAAFLGLEEPVTKE